MERRIRYEALSNEDDSAAEPVATTPDTEVMVEPQENPVADPVAAEDQSTNMPAAQEDKMPEPPPYSIATSLPSYEEAERSKQEEEEEREQNNTSNVEQQNLQNCHGSSTPPDVYLGTDGIFLLTFFVAFIFNWVGLLASMCISQTVAGRFGAMAGFGLSLVKWVAILKHNNWAKGVAEGDSWLWWMFIILGFFIFLRGCVQYLRIKAQWTKLGQIRGRLYLYF